MTTLRLKDLQFAGVPALKIREAPNRGLRDESFTVNLFRDVCKVSNSKAREIAEVLFGRELQEYR